MRRWFRNRSEKRLDQELRFHFDEQVAEYVAAGLSPEEARRRARLEFGHLDEVKEECRDVRPFAWLDGLRRDVRFALRLFARSPGFTAVCLITLALGIGANGAVFSLVNELVLTPPPYPEPDSLVILEQDTEHLGTDFQARRAAPNFPLYPQRNELRSFDEVVALQFSTIELHENDDPETITSAETTQNFLAALKTPPLLGRWFTPAECRERAHVVVLTHSLWSRRFSEDPNIIGRPIRLRDPGGELTPYDVVGVLPARVEGELPVHFRTLEFELFTPYDASRLDNPINSPTLLFARLASGVSPAEATVELVARQSSMYPNSNHNNGGRRMIVRTFADHSIWGVRTGLWVLVSAVGCVLLIVCANLAGILLTRGAARKHEMAIRSGLGAGRRTILSQTFVETGMLALSGGVLALFTAWGGIRGLQTINFASLPDISEASLDWRVIAWCFVLSIVTAILIAALPAWNASRTGALAILRQTAETARSGERRMRDALVITQVALSMVLVVGSGLLVHSMNLLLSVDPGYDPHHVVSLSVMNRTRWPEGMSFWGEVLDRVHATPRVEGAALVNYAPTAPVRAYEGYEILGQQSPPPEDRLLVDARQISANYFSLLRIPLLEGAFFSGPGLDPQSSEVVVNRSFADAHWPEGNAVGQRFKLLDRRPPRDVTVIGVVGDVRNTYIKDQPEPMIYLSEGQRLSELLVRTNDSSGAFIGALKQAVREIDPAQTFYRVARIEENLAAQNAELRFYMYLLSAFAGLALVLAVVGLYSVAAQAAVRRTQEIGLRMAVGASRGQILLMIARQGLVLAGAGIVVGMAASYALSKYLESWIYEITPTDPLTFGAAALLLAAVAWLATFIPARRAARLDPMKALRYE